MVAKCRYPFENDSGNEVVLYDMADATTRTGHEVGSVLCEEHDGSRFFENTQFDRCKSNECALEMNFKCPSGSKAIGSVHTHPDDKYAVGNFQDIFTARSHGHQFMCVLAPRTMRIGCYNIEKSPDGLGTWAFDMHYMHGPAGEGFDERVHRAITCKNPEKGVASAYKRAYCERQLPSSLNHYIQASVKD